MKLRKPSKEGLRRMAAGLWQWTKRKGTALPGLLLSHRFVTTLLVVIIALELVNLGVGTVRRLEQAAKDYERAAMVELAAYEAQAFAKEMDRKKNNAGAASIGTQPVQEGETTPATPAATDDTDPDAPPPLRPRDVETILGQETDDWIASWADDLKGADGTDPADAGTDPEGEDSDETDHYIRQGYASLISGDMRKCILSLEQARALSPNSPAALYYLGMAYDKLLNPAKARLYYTQVFNMRDQAGAYFERASRRLSYGVDQPSAMRGKLSFGQYRVNHSGNDGEGERVDILLPVLLAPGEELKPEGIFIKIRFFDLVNNRRIEFAHTEPNLAWEKGQPDWNDGEENLVISYTAPPLTAEERNVYGDVSYYGFVAKLYYNGEPLDCISTPSSLILHEQRLNFRSSGRRNRNLPEDSLLPEEEAEEATPYSEFLDALDEAS